MSDGPVVNVGAQALEPLVEVALQAKQPKVRIAVLGALSRFPLSHGAWRVYGGVIRTTLEREAPGTALRRKAIEIGAGVPLLSVRNAVRSIAATRTADAKFARKALDDAGDVTGIKPLLAQIRSGKATPDAYKMLARMPLEDAGLAPQDLPKLSGRWHTELWRALALARLGDYSAIDAFLDAASGEEKVSKRRLAARHAAASIHPLPPAMQRHLLERMPELILDIGANMVHFVGQGYIDPVQMQRAAWPILPPGLRIDSMGIAQRVLDEQLRVAELQGIKRLPGPYLSSIVGNLVHEGNRRAQQMRGRKLRVEILGDRIVETLPGPGFVVGDLPVGELLMEQVHTRYTALNDNQLAYVIAHDRADHLMRLTPGVIESAGNAAVRVVEIVGRAGDFQSGRGAAPMRGTSVAFEQEMHVHVPLMDDVTPIISVGRDDYEISQQMRHVGQEYGAPGDLEPGFAPEDDELRSRIDQELQRAREEAERERWQVDNEGVGTIRTDDLAEGAQASDEPQPAGPDETFEPTPEPPPTESEIEGTGTTGNAGPSPRTLASPTRAEPPPTPAGAEPPEPPKPAAGDAPPLEERRVHAQIFHEDTERNTFIAGGEHVITVTIGLPGKVRGTAADKPIQGVDIPEEGVTLDVVLHWGDQTCSDKLILPANRRKSSTSCDLPLHVPADAQVVSAEIAFLYKGRIFEIVDVAALVLAKGVAEQPANRVDVKVQMHRRQVAELSDTKTYGAALVLDRSLRIYDESGAHDFDLQESEAATTWLNNALFVTQDSLVRRRPAVREGDQQLDAEDETVRKLLIRMARHGAVMYNGLEQRGYVDRGPRLQVVNYNPKRYVPIEFIYDLGHPTDEARVCQEGLAALDTDVDRCPRCSIDRPSSDERTKMPTVCPLGFWSLQKVIERLDLSEDARREAAGFDSPQPKHRHLPSFDAALFASSHLVPDDERIATQEAIAKAIAAANYVEDWEKWKSALDATVPLLIALPHHGVSDSIDYLEIGAENQARELGWLYRSQLNASYVNPRNSLPGPVVFLLGCRTNAQTEDGYGLLAEQFLKLKASIVVGTSAEILAKHAAPVAREFVRLLVTDERGEDFGAVMRRARRRMLASGYLMAMGVVALGDAEWRLAPRVN